jgi:hypothetical protein
LNQSIRHLVIIGGTVLLVVGLLLFSYEFPFIETDVYALSAILLGMYAIMRTLQKTNHVKVRKVNIVDMLEQRETEKKDASSIEKTEEV